MCYPVKTSCQKRCNRSKELETLKTLIGLISLIAAANSWGSPPIDKCTTPEGKTYFSNTGCQSTERAERQRLKEIPAVDSSELRNWAKRSPPKREPYAVGNQQSQPQAQKDPFACENARRMYQFERGYRYSKDVQSRYHEMIRACRNN